MQKLSRTMRFAATVVLLAIVAPAQVSAQAKPPVDRAVLTAELQRVIDAHLAAQADIEHISALSASVSLPDGGPNLNVAAGRVSRAPDAATVTPANLFQIGSITKSMTAAVILQLAAEGKLSLDDPIGRWLPEYPPWREVTIRRLLNMTSGIPNYTDARGVFESIARWGIDRRFSDAVLVSFVDPERAGAPPPTKGYDYSNTNYILVGMIVERITGSRFADELTRRILRAGLGLENTFYTADIYPEQVLGRQVSGYVQAGADSEESKALAGLVGTDFRSGNVSWAGAAGGAVATPEDVTRWVRALFQGPVLRATERAALTSVVSMNSGQSIPAVSAEDAQGFGLGVTEVRMQSGRIGWVYEGGTLAYRMLYLYLPDDDLVIAAGANSDGGQKDGLSDLIKALYETVTSRSLQPNGKLAPPTR